MQSDTCLGTTLRRRKAGLRDCAGWGEGKRLQSFIKRLRGDTLPKQFVNFIGRRSMLEHTFLRAEMFMPSDRVFTVVNGSHLKYPEVRRQISSRPGVALWCSLRTRRPVLGFSLQPSLCAGFHRGQSVCESQRIQNKKGT
jgi:hypothetical protein